MFHNFLTMSVKHRLKIFINNEKLTVSNFEKLINVANGYVNSISKSIGIDKIEIILENFPKLNVEWLLVGKGKMLKENDENNGNNFDFKEKYYQSLEEIQGLAKTILNLQEYILKTDHSA